MKIRKGALAAFNKSRLFVKLWYDKASKEVYCEEFDCFSDFCSTRSDMERVEIEARNHDLWDFEPLTRAEVMEMCRAKKAYGYI